uniref:CENP-V/GFA domain-containing protein n=1 Tax=Mycena chlorophos TaxID=658473 RepID=A0ABQ0LHG7_MYCCL|nr:predicted protein [Mycena chlorophos]
MPRLPILWPEGGPTFTYKGGCHCKKICFEFEHPDIYSMPALECNCSICTSRGYIHVYTPQDKFKLTKGTDDDLTTYTFASHLVQHRFCATCGSGIGVAIPCQGFVSINARTLDGIELGRLQKILANGQNLTLSTPERWDEAMSSIHASSTSS